MLNNEFYKVSQSGGSYVVGTFFNPVTKEEKTETLRDYDYCDCSRDNEALYVMPINEEAKKLWMRFNGILTEGDTVKVVKGRKVRIGTVAVVVKIRPVYDRYGRWVADYAVLSTGEQTSISNCEIFEN